MARLKKKVSAKVRRGSGADSLSSARSAAPPITVVIRRQTLEEERRFDAAIKLFLTELVRQQLGRQGATS